MWNTDDTIVAPASPAAGLRSIVRVSGPLAAPCVAECFEADDASWRLAKAARRWPGNFSAGPPLGKVACSLLFWPGTRSYTRQPSAELHLPGCPPLVDACVDALCRAGARLARPGEFTLRAFLAGRLDLTQAEAVLAVIDARDRAELEAGLRQLAGNLAKPLADARAALIDLLAQIEAGLDFVDEDIELLSSAELLSVLESAERRVDGLREQLQRRGQADGAPRVVLYGRPNSGKSSLFNQLGGGDLAIVSRQPGTTRDFLVAELTIDEVRFQLVDTAGFDPRLSAVSDAAAQQLGSEQRHQAQLALLCLDASQDRDPWEREQLSREDARRLVVWTKTDLAPAGRDREGLATSSRTGAGIGQLRAEISRRLAAWGAVGGDVAAGTAARSRDSLRLAADALQSARDLAQRGQGDELVAHELRQALDALGAVAGQLHHEEVLDQVFSRFCIGK